MGASGTRVVPQIQHTMDITIIGAGMSGLIAANMLRKHNVTVYERSPSLPHNHTAVLRFRSPAVSDATGIPFTRGIVRKGLWDGSKVVNEPTLAFINRYSFLVTKELHDRSVLNLEAAERWMAPRDLVEQLAKGINIMYNYDMNAKMIKSWPKPIISTIPMPNMVRMFEYQAPAFSSLPVWTIHAVITWPHSTVCQTLYNTEDGEWYRATLHGQDLTLEFVFDPKGEKPLEDIVNDAWLRFFNQIQTSLIIPAVKDISVSKMAFGKLMPVDEAVRKSFMLYLTERHNIYSLGRFAVWRNILLDDVVQDVKKIETMIQEGHTYEVRKTK